MLSNRLRYFVLTFLFCFFGSELIQNLGTPFLKQNDLLGRYVFFTFNISPRNWGMFTHFFHNAYERKIAYFTTDKRRITQEAKGLNFPWRRTPLNDMLDQIIVNQSKGTPGTMQIRYGKYKCKEGIDHHPIAAIQYLQRTIDIEAYLRGESDLIRYPFVRLSNVYCEDFQQPTLTH